MRIFVAGASGLLGLTALHDLRARHEVTGAYLNHPIRMEGVDTLRLDVGDAAAVRLAVDAAAPDLVINAAGLTNVDACEAQPALATQLNVTAAAHLAEASRRAGARMVHVSTDHLFDGKSPLRREHDSVYPLNAYARTKLEGERVVLRVDPTSLVVRTNFYGWGVPPRTSFTDWILSGLRARRTLPLFTDVHFTPILANDLVDAMIELVERRAEGLVNVAGPERVSKHEFALLVATAFEESPTPIRAARLDEVGLRAPRPPDMSLDTVLAARLLGRALPSHMDGLARLRQLERAGVPSVLAAALG